MPQKGDVISVKAISGKTYKYVWTDDPSSGAMKVVYFSPDKTYVVAFYKNRQDVNDIERLENLVDAYRKGIFNAQGGEYWEKIFCWPTDLIREGDRIGLIVPAYSSKFFFTYDGPLGLKGKEKAGDWYTNPVNHFKNLDEREIGDWYNYLKICLLLARGLRRLHLAGLAHSDLSYRNVLIDPVTSSMTIIDIDGLVVPGKFPPDVYGTKDFIAPEVYATMNLPRNHPNRKLPCQTTDLHALAVLIYMYLLYRHPLRGRKVWDIDPDKDEMLSMGSKAVFIEDPGNNVNRYDVKWVQNDQPKFKWPYLFPWQDLNKLPYTILGRPLKELFDRAFIQGLHNPSARPKAFEWEEALLQTTDLLLPCQNPNCKQKWFVYDNFASKPKCPFCGQPYNMSTPVLNLHYKGKDSYKPTGMHVVVFNGKRLYQWHSNPTIAHNEKLTDEQKKSIAGFLFYQGKWYLRNERSVGMMNLSNNKPVDIGKSVELHNNIQIRLGDENSRMISIEIVNK